MNSRIRKFVSYYHPYRKLFAADITCSILTAGMALLIPLCVRYITKDVLESGLADSADRILITGGIMVALILIQAVTTYFYDYRGHGMGAMMERDMRGELFDHFQKLSFSFYDDHRIGALMSRITNDLLSLAELYHHGPEDLVIYLVKFVGALIVLVWVNAPLASMLLLFLPIMVLYVLHYNKKMRKAFQVNLEHISSVNAQVEENLAGMRVVQSYNGEEAEKRKFSRENNRFLGGRLAIYYSESMLSNGVETLTRLFTAAITVFGALVILRGQLDLADLITFLLYAGYLTEPIPQLARITQQYQEGLTSFNRFMDILELKPEIDDAPDAVELGNVRGEVEFRDVSFSYRDGQEKVLKNLSLKVRAGEHVALVGHSGVGKSTLCSLVPRFYDSTAGQIFVDGVDVKRATLKSLRENVGTVQQDTYLFSGSILDNIRYGRPDAAREEIIEAAKSAGAHEFIDRLPGGYDTDIGPRGVRLSGGERQRLSIARVFLKNPPILIFDEATSALDTENERAVQASLNRLAKDRTTFVIAHRLSTVRHADRIVVLSADGIAEQGTHNELIARAGIYARMYEGT